MSAKVRYILGAGASYGAIPMVKEMPKRVLEYHYTFKFLSEFLIANSTHGSKKMDRALSMRKWAGVFAELQGKLNTAFSFDTLAKFYWAQGHNGEKKYNELKGAISLLIASEHLINPHNPRYDAFIAAVAIQNQSLEKVGNIEVLNWNYDFQFLQSMRSIKQNITLQEVNKTIQQKYLNGNTLISDMNLVPPETNVLEHFDNYVESKKLSAKLKGIIKRSALDFSLFWNNDLFEQIIHNAGAELNFSWEIESKELKRTLSAFNPDCAVIIGYSLPTYNRSIDMLILEPFIGVESGRRVYVQCATEENSQIESKLIGMGVNPKIISSVNQVDEFHIPFEYNL